MPVHNPLYPIMNEGSKPGPGAMTLYLDSTPYPEVDSAPYDPDSIALIKTIRSGKRGELTAVLMYVFQNNRIQDNDTFANAMLQVAVVEMTHLDMLGDAIQALGGEPCYDDGEYYWQASEVNYATTIPDMLRADIEAETEAIAAYNAAAAKTTNPQLRALFNRIRKDEELHLQFFSEQLRKLTPSGEAQ